MPGLQMLLLFSWSLAPCSSGFLYAQIECMCDLLPTCAPFRAIQDRTASREEPKEKPETSAPWYSALRT